MGLKSMKSICNSVQTCLTGNQHIHRLSGTRSIKSTDGTCFSNPFHIDFSGSIIAVGDIAPSLADSSAVIKPVSVSDNAECLFVGWCITSLLGDSRLSLSFAVDVVGVGRELNVEEGTSFGSGNVVSAIATIFYSQAGWVLQKVEISPVLYLLKKRAV